MSGETLLYMSFIDGLHQLYPWDICPVKSYAYFIFLRPSVFFCGDYTCKSPSLLKRALVVFGAAGDDYGWRVRLVSFSSSLFSHLAFNTNSV
jgi:hypothetical protein